MVKREEVTIVVDGYEENIVEHRNPEGKLLYTETVKTPILKEKREIVEYELPQRDLKEVLREKRIDQCFAIINRGKLWYDKLTLEQIESLKLWYKAWLDVTETLVEPTKPEWLK